MPYVLQVYSILIKISTNFNTFFILKVRFQNITESVHACNIFSQMMVPNAGRRNRTESHNFMSCTTVLTVKILNIGTCMSEQTV